MQVSLLSEGVAPAGGEADTLHPGKDQYEMLWAKASRLHGKGRPIIMEDKKDDGFSFPIQLFIPASTDKRAQQ